MTMTNLASKRVGMVFIDGMFNYRGSGARVILEKDCGLIVKVLLIFEFPTTNNQAEYEVVIAGILLTKEMGAERLELKTNSQLLYPKFRGKCKLNTHCCNNILSWLEKS